MIIYHSYATVYPQDATVSSSLFGWQSIGTGGVGPVDIDFLWGFRPNRWFYQ